MINEKVTIEYRTSILVAAGWRSITVTAIAEKISPKRAKVIDVIEINGEPVTSRMSRTGANRQSFNGDFVARIEVGKNKILSKCYIVNH